MLRDELKRRMDSRIPFELLGKLFPSTTVYVAGNCCNRLNPNDIDVFPAGNMQFYGLGRLLEDLKLKVLSQTKNATTISHEGQIIQLCNYYHATLPALIGSFDFAHLQIGVAVSNKSIVDIQYTSAWEQSHLLESTYYTGSEYPMSSLLRLLKYKERGDFAGNSHVYATLSILTDIVTRGFADYNDFKDQMDAVDLGLLPEDLRDDRDMLWRLFNALNREVVLG